MTANCESAEPNGSWDLCESGCGRNHEAPPLPLITGEAQQSCSSAREKHDWTGLVQEPEIPGSAHLGYGHACHLSPPSPCPPYACLSRYPWTAHDKACKHARMYMQYAGSM
jgi:hypothetical protein